jgi:flagellar FliL protein
MAKTKKTEDNSTDDEPRGKVRKLVLIAAALVALLAGGYVVTSGGAGTDAASAADAVEEPVAGAVVALDPITLNLADGRFLKVGLALQLVEGAAPPAEADVAGFAAPALDDAISLLGALTYGDLVAPGGRDAARDSLSQRISARYEGEVMGVYFTELVMQ